MELSEIFQLAPNLFLTDPAAQYFTNEKWLSELLSSSTTPINNDWASRLADKLQVLVLACQKAEGQPSNRYWQTAWIHKLPEGETALGLSVLILSFVNARNFPPAFDAFVYECRFRGVSREMLEKAFKKRCELQRLNAVVQEMAS